MKRYVIWNGILFVLIISLIIDKIVPAHVNFIPATLIGIFLSFILFFLGVIYFLLEKEARFFSQKINQTIGIFKIYTAIYPIYLIIAISGTSPIRKLLGNDLTKLFSENVMLVGIFLFLFIQVLAILALLFVFIKKINKLLQK